MVSIPYPDLFTVLQALEFAKNGRNGLVKILRE